MTSAHPEAPIRVLSWNVNGLGDRIKRRIVSQFLKRHSPDVVLLQETHLKGNTYRALDRGGYQIKAHAGFTSGSRGVGILIKKSLPFVIQATHTDMQGRYIAVTGMWAGQVLNILSIYVPPRLHHQLFPDLGDLLLQLPKGALLMGGDFNLVMDESRDRWPIKGLTIAKSPLADFVGPLGLVDLWRLHNPDTLQYTFHSGAHGSLSRIDYLLVQMGQTHSFRNVRLMARGISDHAPVWAVFGHQSRDTHSSITINPWYLRVPAIGEGICKATELYFKENAQSVESPLTLWEAYKAVIRGQALSVIVGHKKEKRAQLDSLEKDIQLLEQKAITTGASEDRHNLLIKQKEYRNVVDDAAKLANKAVQHKLYEVGDKAGKLLHGLTIENN